MALKKSDLYASLWASCDQLRGGMDASQYKDYILTLLFVKYVSDKAKSDPDSLNNIPAGGSFDDMLAAKGDKEIGDRFNKIIAKLAEANRLRNVIDLADFNDEEKLGKGKEMQDRLSKLVTIFSDLDFRGSRADGDDLLGDAYEYLMRHFATESGKSKGQFYTPAEVSRILAKVVGIGSDTRQDQTVYDPACGSGSLLLKAAAEAPRGMTIYGQEKDNATWALSKMNMILHSNEIAGIEKGDTITNPQFTKGDRLGTFDFIVMNPPFSVKSWNNGLENDYGRFEYGRPPEKNGDYAFLLHALTSLKSTGKGAIILPHGVLFRGNAEATIRTRLLKQGFIKGVIGLPANLFYGTGIPACIVILDKENAVARSGVFMIDASKGFIKDGNKNRLRSQDIHKIVDTFNKQIEVPCYSRMVQMSEIADPKNGFNLNIPRYIDSSGPEDVQDLHAHLHGGIPNADLDALSAYWEAFPQLRRQLFKPNRPGYSDLTIDVSEVQQSIIESPEFQKFADEAHALIEDWFVARRASLAEINENTAPADLIVAISEDLLARFRPVPLLDEYGVYERLMNYWQTTMHDDVGLIMAEGWLGASRPRPARVIGTDKNGKPRYEDAHIKTGARASTARFAMDLVPPELIVRTYLEAEAAQAAELTEDAEEAGRTLEEYLAEQAVEDGLIWSAVDGSEKVTQKSVTSALKEAKLANDDETIEALQKALRLIKADAAGKKAAKEALGQLDLATLNQYSALNAGEALGLVLDTKWFAAIAEQVKAEVAALASVLVHRVQLLGQRYGVTLGDIDLALGELRHDVERSFADMGVDELLTGRRRLPGFDAEWPEVCLGDHVTYVKTVALSRAQLDSKSPTRYLHYGDIHTSDAIFLDAVAAPMPRARRGLLKNAGHLEPGDLVFADASEDPAGVGKSIEVSSVPPAGVVPGLHTIAARFDKSVLVDGYKAYLQFIPEFRNALLRLAAGTKVLATTRTYISSVTLHLPPADEQRAIVHALGRVNAEIEWTERRLKKSRDIRVAVRQQLLQGTTRLPAPGDVLR